MNTKLIYATLAVSSFALSLSGCMATVPQSSSPQYQGRSIGSGQIISYQLLARTPDQFKSYAGQYAFAGGAIGAALGLAYGVTAGAVFTGVTVGLFSLFVNPAALILSGVIAGTVVGASVGGIVGTSKKVFEKGYLFYRFDVQMDGAQKTKIVAQQFTKFAYPIGSRVEVMMVQGKKNHVFYTVKLLSVARKVD